MERVDSATSALGWEILARRYKIYTENLPKSLTVKPQFQDKPDEKRPEHALKPLATARETDWV